jgi:predicted enzyme related to lactoylglutathione lyase
MRTGRAESGKAFEEGPMTASDEETKRPTLGNGKICYIEIPAEDVNASSKFYTTVFGWKIRTRDDGSIAFDDAVGEVSGTWRTDRKVIADVGTLIYIMVDDIKATIAAITVAGGEIVQPAGMDAPEITARFADPAGNVFGLYQEPG